MKRKKKEYFFASAKVAALEKNLPQQSDFLRAAQAESLEEACRIIESKSEFKISGFSDPIDLERKLDDYLAAHYEMLEDMTGSIGITYPFRYPTDAHNLKVLAKRHSDSLLKKGGTIEAEELPAQLLRIKDVYSAEEIIDNAAREAIKLKSQELGLSNSNPAGVQAPDFKTGTTDFAFPAFENLQTSPFGTDSIAAYIHALMRAIHACRLTLALKQYNIPPAKIIERINRIYEQ